MMTVKFWGVRGSIPCPGPTTVDYGGNTACLELRFGDEERLIIIDAGSGIRSLGNYLMQHDLPKGPIDTSIFITHTHWDHIMGFPFFTPIFIPGSSITIYGPVTYEDEGLDRIIGDQLTYRYFPVKHSELAAKIKYVALKESTMDLGDGIKVTTKYLNHPILCLGYRFEYEGRVFCTVYDTEPFRNLFRHEKLGLGLPGGLLLQVLVSGRQLFVGPHRIVVEQRNPFDSGFVRGVYHILERRMPPTEL